MTEPFPWDPLALDDVLELMEGFSAPWWIGGGWALDLHIGRQTREHADVDVIIRRTDQELLRALLPSWDICVAHEGTLEPWTAQLQPPRHGLWARSDAARGWQVEFLLAETEGTSGSTVGTRTSGCRSPTSSCAREKASRTYGPSCCW